MKSLDSRRAAGKTLLLAVVPTGRHLAQLFTILPDLYALRAQVWSQPARI